MYPSKSNIFCGRLKGHGRNSRIRIQRHGSTDPNPDLYENVTEPEHWFKDDLLCNGHRYSLPDVSRVKPNRTTPHSFFTTLPRLLRNPIAAMMALQRVKFHNALYT